MEETKTKNEWEKRLRDYFHGNVSIVGEHWIEGMIKIVNGILSSERQKWEKEKLIIPKGKTHSEHDECENCIDLGREKECQRLRERIEKMKVFIDYPDTEDGRKSRHENRLYNSALDKVLKLLFWHQKL